jgi:hydroxymethylpyrimidine pyrophosphatase-like HAD family hydrolase
MIDLIQYGIAMANAKSKLKEVAKYTTVTNNEHGVAVGIRAILRAAAIAKKGNALDI